MTVKCSHWTPTAKFANAGRCDLGHCGGYPGVQFCQTCPDYDGPSRGLGDTIAKATKAVGVKPCAGCQKRQAALNRRFPRQVYN